MIGFSNIVTFAPIPVQADTLINFEDPVGIDPATGLARTFTDGDLFAGFSTRTVNNEGGAAGALSVGAYSASVPLPVALATAANIGDPVYSPSAGVYDLTSTTKTQVGIVENCYAPYSAANCLVHITTFRG